MLHCQSFNEVLLVMSRLLDELMEALPKIQPGSLEAINLYELHPGLMLEMRVDENIVAHLMGTSVSTVQKARGTKDGIPYEKHGRSVRYRLGTVLEHLNSKRVTCTADALSRGLPTRLTPKPEVIKSSNMQICQLDDTLDQTS
jgi:hypothetical protein